MIKLNKAEYNDSIPELMAGICDDLANHFTDDIAAFFYINAGGSKGERWPLQLDQNELRTLKHWLSGFLFLSVEHILNKVNIDPRKLAADTGIHFGMVLTDPYTVRRIDSYFKRIVEQHSGSSFTKENAIQQLSEVSHLYSFDERIITEIVESGLNNTPDREPVLSLHQDLVVQNLDIILFEKISKNPGLVHTLHWREFEKLLAKILEAFEYEVELCKGSKDGGIDLIAIKKTDPLGTHKYLIQAKRYSNKVGIEPVQRLLFLKNEMMASKACLVTTSQFTSGAWNLARKYLYELELKDYQRLQDWIAHANILRTNNNLLL